MSARQEHSEELVVRLRTHVDRLAGLIGPRHTGCPTSLDAAASFIERELSRVGHPVTRQSYRIHDLEVANLVAEMPGESPEDGPIIVGAHYDTVDASPGADDNASAIAVILEAARILHGTRLRKTVRFAAFACEEPPHFCTGRWAVKSTLSPAVSEVNALRA